MSEQTLKIESTPDGPVYITTPEQRTAIRKMLDGAVQRPREYQRSFLADDSRFRIAMFSRQSGKSHVLSMDDVMLAGETGYPVMELSASLDQTKELILKAAFFAEAFADISGEIQRAVLSGSLTDLMYKDDDGVKITQTIITLPGGQRIIGRPANPRTARGFSAHVTMDEFSIHRDSDEIWAACMPSIVSSPVLRVKVASTPKGQKGKFYSLWADTTGIWSKHKVTLHDAIRMGLVANFQELADAIGDEEIVQQELLCEFVDEATAFLDFDLIRTCEHEGLSVIHRVNVQKSQTDEEISAMLQLDRLIDMSTLRGGELYAGFDVARRGDLSVISIFEQVNQVFWPRLILELHNCPFRLQEAFCNDVMGTLRTRRMCVDQTGIGEQIAENLNFHWKSKVEPVHFGKADVKQELAEGLRPMFQDQKIRIPIDVKLKNDLHSVTKMSTASGNVRYIGERNKNGHADRFWSIALAIHGADTIPVVQMTPENTVTLSRDRFRKGVPV